MSEYIRARTDEQKEERLNQIKNAADSLFEKIPYTEINLTTIADELGWSRANLYKYVTTKEEIFLELCSEKMGKYFNAVLSAFPQGNNFSLDVIAEVWAGLLNANQDYLRYVSYLNPIIETHVTVERLAIFKKKWYDFSEEFAKRLSSMLKIDSEKSYKLVVDVQIYASSLVPSCLKNELVKKALKLINHPFSEPDFCATVKDFINMSINWNLK